MYNDTLIFLKFSLVHCHALRILIIKHKQFAGTSSGVAFDQVPQASIEEIMDGGTFVNPTYDEMALCSAAFRVLRSMVNVWFRDVVLHQNRYADFQMVHFYR